MTIGAASALAPQTSVVLAGGGNDTALGKAVFTLAGTSNVNLASIDATALASDLVISGVTTKAGASITLGSGSNKVTLAQADLARDAIVLNGGDGTDTAVFTLADATADVDLRPGLNSVEKLTITQTVAGGGADAFDYNLNLADTDAVSTITLDPAGSDDSLVVSGASGDVVLSLADDYSATTVGVTVNGATGLTVNNSAVIGGDIDITAANATDVTVALKNTSNISVDALTVAKATTVNLGGNNTTSVGAAYAGDITVASLVAASGTTLNIDSTQGNVAIPTLTAKKLATINVVGDGTFTAGATAATTSALASIDGSTATGAITVTQNMDFASGASIKTGTANDVITLDVLTEGGVAIDMGEKTADNDTLSISGANNMGLTVVDLSAADQISQLNGAINGAVQTGVESIDLSGLTGSFGVTVTGSGDANTITGTANADNIIAGGGADTITGGDGADTIDLAESTAKADKYVVNAVTDGAPLGEDESINADTVTNFDAGVDKIAISAAIELALGNGNADGTLDVATAAQNAIDKDSNDEDVFVLTGTTEDDLDDLSDIITAIGTVTNTAGDDFFVVVNNAAGTQAGLYYVETGGANAGAVLTAAEVALVGIVNTDAAIGTADLALI